MYTYTIKSFKYITWIYSCMYIPYIIYKKYIIKNICINLVVREKMIYSKIQYDRKVKM